MSPPVLSIVVPCFNEADVLPETIRRLDGLLADLAARKQLDAKSYIVFIDDGSTDDSWNIIRQHHDRSDRIKGIKLSRNFGHQPALLCGLLAVEGHCDCSVTTDADLQHRIEIIERFLERYVAGDEIVYGIKAKRNDPLLRRVTAKLFYRLMSCLGTQTIPDHADYRLLGRNALAALAQFRESNLFLRGLVPLLGFRSSCIRYDVEPRLNGRSKYSWHKMFALAIAGVTSFSIVPLRLASAVGMLVVLCSFAAAGFSVWAYMRGSVVPGWTSIVVAVYFFGGIQLCFLGIIGEYLGKLVIEVKRRPRYLVEQRLD